MTSFGKPSSGNKKDGQDPSVLTKETQALLQDVMQKRGLSVRAAQDVASSLKKGDGDWVNLLSTGTAHRTMPASKTQATVKVPKFRPKPTGPIAPLGPPASFSGKRMHTTVPERDIWVGGGPVVDREAQKDELAQIMTAGSAQAHRRKQAELQAAQEAAEAAAANSRPLDVREALIDQLISEVSERTEFLEAMRVAGKADAYEAQIKGEVAQRLQQLKAYGVDVSAGKPTGGAASASRAVLPPWQCSPAANTRH